MFNRFTRVFKAFDTDGESSVPDPDELAASRGEGHADAGDACWFCGAARPEAASSLVIEMYTRATESHYEPSRYVTTTTTTGLPHVRIPRCARCAGVHDEARCSEIMNQPTSPFSPHASAEHVRALKVLAACAVLLGLAFGSAIGLTLFAQNGQPAVWNMFYGSLLGVPLMGMAAWLVDTLVFRPFFYGRKLRRLFSREGTKSVMTVLSHPLVRQSPGSVNVARLLERT